MLNEVIGKRADTMIRLVTAKTRNFIRSALQKPLRKASVMMPTDSTSIEGAVRIRQ